MLTDALVKDFVPAYKKLSNGMWARTDEEGRVFFVSDEQLWKDVEEWLLGLEEAMDNDSDKAFAKIVTHMIRKNKGWVTLLTERVKRRLEK
jgi:hypothetical protein